MTTYSVIARNNVTRQSIVSGRAGQRDGILWVGFIDNKGKSQAKRVSLGTIPSATKRASVKDDRFELLLVKDSLVNGHARFPVDRPFRNLGRGVEN